MARFGRGNAPFQWQVYRVRYDAGLPAIDLVVSPPEFGTPVLEQVHNLAATSLEVGSPAIGAPTLVEVVYLSTSGLTVDSPELGSPALGQKHVLSPSALAVASPVLATPALKQVHVLPSATALSIGSPVISTSAIGQTHVLVAANWSGSSPSLGTPSIEVGYSLSAISLVVNRPVFGVPTLHSKHALTPLGLSVHPPSLGSPTLVTPAVLVAIGLTVSHPVLGTPLLLSPVMTALPFSVGSWECSFDVSPRAWFKQQGSVIREDEFEDGTPDVHPIQISIFTNYNDKIDIDVHPKTLVGNTRAERGEAQAIYVKGSLKLENQFLLIDEDVLFSTINGVLSDEVAARITTDAVVTVMSASLESLMSSFASLKSDYLALAKFVSVGKGAQNLTVGSPVFGTPVLTVN